MQQEFLNRVNVRLSLFHSMRKFIGSQPSDHYFRSVCLSVCLFVCLSVCLFVCAEFFSAVFDPIWIKLGHMLHVRVQLCPLEYRGCMARGGWMTPKKTCIFRGFGAAVNHQSVTASFCKNAKTNRLMNQTLQSQIQLNLYPRKNEILGRAVFVKFQQGVRAWNGRRPDRETFSMLDTRLLVKH